MASTDLIAAHELIELLRHDAVLVVDCRFRLDDSGAGKRDYAAGHVPGAEYADLDLDLSDLHKSGLGRHPLPDEQAFAATLSRWGWHAGMRVVAYDAAGGGLAAARLWWMLRLLGEHTVSVLDGGWQAWQEVGGAVVTDTPSRAPSSVDIAFDAGQMVGYDELQSALATQSVRLLDARAAARYRGEVEPLDAVAGHVPGALNRPHDTNIDAHGRFKSPVQLRAEFLPLIGEQAPEAIVHMCGSGVTACHNLLAMEYAGLHGSRLFAPSWSGWISDPKRPVAVGAAPG
ncbi:MAG: sulfurtransferase [Dokdonella sp.]